MKRSSRPTRRRRRGRCVTLQLPEAECIGDAFADCLVAQTDITSTGMCESGGRRVCLLPLGHVSPALIQHLVTYYAEQYGLDVIVMPRTAIPSEVADDPRDQTDAVIMLEYMAHLSPAAFADPGATVIGQRHRPVFFRQHVSLCVRSEANRVCSAGHHLDVPHGPAAIR
jgi:hypothetical protein